MTAPERVLVLDGHKNQALACVRSLGRAGFRVLVASHRAWPLGAWSRYCCRHFRVEGETIEAFARLREWARLQEVRVVLPVTERSCILCNAERHDWEQAGITVGCGPDAMLLHAFDKAQTLQRASSAGLAVPTTFYPTSLAECRAAAPTLGFPCIVKPRFSNHWDGNGFSTDHGTTYVRNLSELETAALERKQGIHWPLLQAFVPGRGKGVFALSDHGHPVAWFAHERLRDVRPSGSGSSLRRSVRLDPRLRAPAERLLAELQWHGPAMVEFRDDGKHPPWLMEVNGRFWGSLQLAIDAGTDFPRLWIDILSGRRVGPVERYREDITSRWLWGDVKRLFYILSGPPPGYPENYPSLWQGLRELFGYQPAGTRLEVFRATDPFPALGEWVEGIREVLARRHQHGV